MKKSLRIALAFFVFLFIAAPSFAANTIGIIAPEPPIFIDDPIITATPSQAPQPPQDTCMQRPACLDSKPRCMIAEPADGWCPTPITPEPKIIDITPTPEIGEPTADPDPVPPPGCYYKPGICPMIACTTDYCPPCNGILTCPGTPFPTGIHPSITPGPTIICDNGATCVIPTQTQNPSGVAHAYGHIHKKTLPVVKKPFVNPIVTTISKIWGFLSHLIH